MTDPWVSPNAIYAARVGTEKLGRTRWDNKYAQRFDYSASDPRTPHGSPINMDFMSWMSEMPDKVLDEFEAKAGRRAPVSQRSSVSNLRREAQQHGEAWSPGRGYSGAWHPFKRGKHCDTERQELMSFQSTAHDFMRTQGKVKKSLRASLHTPDINPQYPSANRMTPGTVSLERSKRRSKSSLAANFATPRDSGSLLTPKLNSPKVSTARNGAELRTLKTELQRAMQRCTQKLSDSQKRSEEEVQALQKLSAQQKEAMQELEQELQAAA